MGQMALRLESGLVTHKSFLLLVILATFAGFAYATGGWNVQDLRFFWMCNLSGADRPATMQEATVSYRRFLHILRKRGFRKEPSETPQEFAEKITPALLNKQTAEFTRLYNAMRYGAERPPMPLLRDMLQKISATAGQAPSSK